MVPLSLTYPIYFTGFKVVNSVLVSDVYVIIIDGFQICQHMVYLQVRHVLFSLTFASNF